MNTEIDRKIAVILVADVVGYSKHMERDENATLKAYAECEKILKTCLKKYKGSIFNTAGDSALAEFPSAVNAVECGVEMLRLGDNFITSLNKVYGIYTLGFLGFVILMAILEEWCFKYHNWLVICCFYCSYLRFDWNFV